MLASADVTRSFEACARGVADALRTVLGTDPAPARLANPASPHGGWTGVHAAARPGTPRRCACSWSTEPFTARNPADYTLVFLQASAP